MSCKGDGEERCGSEGRETGEGTGEMHPDCLVGSRTSGGQ